MFSKPRVESSLERAFERAIRSLVTQEVGSEEYMKKLDAVTRLHKMKEEEKPSSVSRDTLAAVFGNLAGIFMIIWFERSQVIRSRALNLVLRSRV